jgi:hypothetical protein
MGLAVLDARETANGLEVTFVTDAGLEQIEGSHAEVARLAHVMQQVSALAPLNETDNEWIEAVTVGEATVRLGLAPGGRARLLIERERDEPFKNFRQRY